MSAIAAITIADGKATPVNHTYDPVESGPNSMFRTAISSLPTIGQEGIRLGIKKTRQGINIVSVQLELPALETATNANSAGYTAAPKVAYKNTVSVQFFMPDRGTADQRKDLRVLLANLLTNAQVVDVVDSLKPPF